MKYVIYIQLPKFCTEEHNKYSKELMHVICNDEVEIMKSENITVLKCVVPPEHVDLVHHLSFIDAVSEISETDLRSEYPELFESNEAIWKQYCDKLGIADKDSELNRLRELYKVDDLTLLMQHIRKDYL